jgi:hypothetical protein
MAWMPDIIKPVPVAARPVGRPVTLVPGDNEVDAAFWRAWSAQHAGSRLLWHFAVVEPLKPPSPIAPAA